MVETEDVFDPIEEICEELGRAITSQTSRLSIQDTAIANISDCILDITSMLKDLQASIGGQCSPESSNQAATRLIKLDLPKFQGSDPDGWIFQAEEYFSFHEIKDDS